MPQIFIGATHVGGCDELYALEDDGKLDPLLAKRISRHDKTAGTAQTFRAGLIQMRSGRDAAANLDAAAKLIGEAKDAGADYVQTPEMTNIMELDARETVRHDRAGRNDTSLAAFRDLARKLSLYIHVGSLAIKVSPEKAANRAFLIDPQGEIVARYDKIHMFDVDLASGESYRESRNYRAGELAVRGRPAVGRASA